MTAIQRNAPLSTETEHSLESCLPNKSNEEVVPSGSCTKSVFSLFLAARLSRILPNVGPRTDAVRTISAFTFSFLRKKSGLRGPCNGRGADISEGGFSRTCARVLVAARLSSILPNGQVRTAVVRTSSAAFEFSRNLKKAGGQRRYTGRMTAVSVKAFRMM